VLKPLMRMGNAPVLGHCSFEKFFRLFYFPDSQAGGFVNLVLKKNRHRSNLRFLIADLRFYHCTGIYINLL
jgi:hypothetical protein